MVYRGKIKNGVVVLDEPGRLKEGAVVAVEPLRTPRKGGKRGTVGQRLLKHAGVVRGLST